MTSVIVVPCFNEAQRWNLAYWQSMLELPGISWIFVNDGSSDATGDLIRATMEFGRADALELQPNGGKAEAVRRGLLRALEAQNLTGAVGFMDADGAFNTSDVADLLVSYESHADRLNGADAVWSSRVALAGRDISRSTSRHYLGRGVATLVSLGQTEMPYDTQSGLKLFQPSDELRRSLSDPFQTRWLFELELMARWESITGASMRIWEEPLNYWHDVPGSKITSKESWRILRELAVLKGIQRRARRAK